MKVIEIFESIQGEGFNAGRPAIFVRFAGCNLHCEFCDTKYSWVLGEEYSVDGILKKIVEYNARLVVLTGGEPLIQDHEELAELVNRLRWMQREVAMESNGVILLDRQKIRIDWLTISPKTALFNAVGNELKLLYDGTQDVEFYEQFNFEYFYLQPILPEKDLIHCGDVAEFMKVVYKRVQLCVEEAKRRTKWRVSFQAHKILGIR